MECPGQIWADTLVLCTPSTISPILKHTYPQHTLPQTYTTAIPQAFLETTPPFFQCSEASTKIASSGSLPPLDPGVPGHVAVQVKLHFAAGLQDLETERPDGETAAVCGVTGGREQTVGGVPQGVDWRTGSAVGLWGPSESQQ